MSEVSRPRLFASSKNPGPRLHVPKLMHNYHTQQPSLGGIFFRRYLTKQMEEIVSV